MSNATLSKHALVIGGSMAGMLAARVLSDYFDHVTVVERDRYPEGPEFRNGTPQARHFHTLLARGMVIMEQLFPGLKQTLLDAGAVEYNYGSEALWLTTAGWATRYESKVTSVTCSRSLVDWAVRRHLTALPNITLIDNADTTGLLYDSQTRAVTGVRIQKRKQADAEPHSIEADLVVDASGRSSRLPEWLTALGYDAPAETLINSFTGYATRLYERPANWQADWKCTYLFSKPPHIARGGALFPIEGNRWILTLGGAAEDYPPTDEDGFMEFIKNLRDPIIYNAIKDATPLSPIYGYRRTENRLRHYETLSRYPEGLLAVGDAVCAFNPIYGQGITTAAIGALTLRESLEHQTRHGTLNGLGRSFQRRLAQSNVDPWLVATSAEYLYPKTVGGQPSLKIKLLHRYLNLLLPVASIQPEIFERYVQVMSMLKPPQSLLTPRMIGAIVMHAIRPKNRQLKRPELVLQST